ncbi:hypothetical protein A0J61_09188 [Choanephora cucurbitarum]|uniref:Uncharacterized protein n=1 Tax=Choanephora cucurbitarum TaxID=101091 RepID=A0A1C7N2A1_9FUNG|nr:hypothetical protein A0J61_09188 [Choanephora cucurbitarum]
MKAYLLEDLYAINTFIKGQAPTRSYQKQRETHTSMILALPHPHPPASSSISTSHGTSSARFNKPTSSISIKV